MSIDQDYELCLSNLAIHKMFNSLTNMELQTEIKNMEVKVSQLAEEEIVDGSAFQYESFKLSGYKNEKLQPIK
jgi:hypothetical protein